EHKVPAKIATARMKKLMSLQRKISRKKNRKLVGRTLEVLVEGPSEESELVMVGRHAGQAPEIDGIVYLSGGEVVPGRMVQASIIQATDYDLVGDVSLAPLPAAPSTEHRESPLHHRPSDGRRVHLRTV